MPTLTSSLRRSTVSLLAALLVLAFFVPSAAHAATTRGDLESEMVSLINRDRKARGLNALTVERHLRDISRDWSYSMQRRGTLEHSTRLAERVGPEWQRIGENVGVGPVDTRTLHQAFMDSDGHRANILGKYNTVGVGIVVEGSRLWVTVTFVQRPTSSTGTSKASTSRGSGAFGDDDRSVHEANIEKLAAAGITKGCDTRRFCPERGLTRAEMATFLARALGLKATAENFRDVGSSDVHAGNIGALAKSGITRGCGDGRFCPDRVLTRAEMASFLARALELSPASESFADVRASDLHAGNIGALAKAGITKGCGGNNYCPTRTLTRAEMASFLVRAFGLG